MSRPPGACRHAAELDLLSFNMQVGIGTKRYREYLTRGWRHLLPSLAMQENLARIGDLVAGYDIVGLQEVDAGSRRSGYDNQIEQLAARGGFAYWHALVNRDFGHMAQHGLGLLARVRPFAVSEHALPGTLPGRGALLAQFGDPATPLVVVVTHLALTRGSRAQQLMALRRLVAPFEHVVVMADTNCSAGHLRRAPALADGGLRVHGERLATFPSWRPRRGIDHILTSPGLTVQHAEAVDVRLSDHLPVSMRVVLPPAVADGLSRPEAVTDTA